jgi:DNA processing protein
LEISMPTRFCAADDPESFVACHRLLTALLPPHRLRALLTFVGNDPAAVLGINALELQRNPALALTEKQALRLAEAASASLPARLTDDSAAKGIAVLSAGDPLYPANLMPHTDAPPLLVVRGALTAEDARSIAIVGSRRATMYGRAQADRFSRAFVERGLTVVSGGAAGIDTAAHRGALDAGGRTVAILGCGVDVVYPAENRSLFEEIVARGGALISEFPVGTKPEPWRFPARNRIIAGMTQATVLIETPQDSGAMITARDAADYGREVWAVPGPVEGGRSRGCHRLIQDGAGLADSPADVLRAIGIETDADDTDRPPPRPRSRVLSAAPLRAAPKIETLFEELPDLSTSEASLLTAFDTEARHIDEAARRVNLSASEAAVALTLLEMKGLLRRHPGNLYVRVR